MLKKTCRGSHSPRSLCWCWRLLLEWCERKTLLVGWWLEAAARVVREKNTIDWLSSAANGVTAKCQRWLHWTRTWDMIDCADTQGEAWGFSPQLDLRGESHWCKVLANSLHERRQIKVIKKDASVRDRSRELSDPSLPAHAAATVPLLTYPTHVLHVVTWSGRAVRTQIKRPLRLKITRTKLMDLFLLLILLLLYITLIKIQTVWVIEKQELHSFVNFCERREYSLMLSTNSLFCRVRKSSERDGKYRQGQGRRDMLIKGQVWIDLRMSTS